MEFQSPATTQSLDSDIISTLPQNITEEILIRMPLRDAVRTCTLSKKWRYSWRGMPQPVFTNDMLTLTSGFRELKKYKLVSAIFHVLMFHNGPTTLVFDIVIGFFRMEAEFAQMLSYLARGNTVKQLSFLNNNTSYKLPVSFFSLHGLEHMHLQSCTFEPPLTCNKFSLLQSMTFGNVEVSAKMLKRFLPKCPLLEHIHLIGHQNSIDFVTEGSKFTFVDLLRCVPSIKTLDISKYYSKYLYAGGMPHKLPTSPVHLKDLLLYVCLMEQNEITSALCMIRSSPVLEKIVFQMYDNDKLPVRKTPSNCLDPEGHPDLKLDHLETLVIEEFGNLPLEMEFVKLIMAKSPVLKNVRIELTDNVSVDEELKMLRDLVRLPIPRASPSANLIFVRP